VAVGWGISVIGSRGVVGVGIYVLGGVVAVAVAVAIG